jgi:hypothetical protein
MKLLVMLHFSIRFFSFVGPHYFPYFVFKHLPSVLSLLNEECLMFVIRTLIPTICNCIIIHAVLFYASCQYPATAPRKCIVAILFIFLVKTIFLIFTVRLLRS